MGVAPRPGRPREVAPGVHRLSTASPSGLTVHLYVLRQGGTTLLVDAGWTHTTAAVEERLAEIDVRIEDLDGVLLTHSHEDHMGGTVVWRDRLACPVHGWRHTTPLFGNFYEHYDLAERWDAWFDLVLPEGPLRDTVLERRSLAPRAPLRQGGDGTIPTARPVDFGEDLRIGPFHLHYLDGRGHDPFHGGWWLPDRNLLFTGDVLLRVPTPIMPAMDDDIALYRQTLDRWQALAASPLVLPGHGPPEPDLGACIQRSRAWLAEAWTTLEDGLDPVTPFNAAQAALELASRSGRDLPRKLFTWLTNLDAQLEELAEMGITRRRPDRHWELLRPLPSYTSLPG